MVTLSAGSRVRQTNKESVRGGTWGLGSPSMAAKQEKEAQGVKGGCPGALPVWPVRGTAGEQDGSVLLLLLRLLLAGRCRTWLT